MRHSYAGPREKRIDLWLGFGGWLVLGAGSLPVAVMIGSPEGQVIELGLVPAATILATVFLALTRFYAAMGIGLALGAVAGLVVLEIPFLVVGLIVDVATGGPHTEYCANSRVFCVGPPSVTGALTVGLAVFLVGAWLTLRAIHQRIR